jgi:hypothetical protein
MKSKTNEFSVPLKIKRTLSIFLGQILAGLMACLAFSAPAAVQVTRFDPPVQISAYAEPSGDSFFCVLAADLDANDQVDFRLEYAYGDMSAFFNAPVRFGQRVAQPGVEGRFGPLAGVPLGSIIGTNIVSSVATNFYAWCSGYTNRDDLTQTLGDHQASVITTGVSYPFPGPIVTISTNGFTTNFFYPQPTVSGDAAYKDAVMALEFYIDGQRHYGYIHFNFNDGAAGVIYGWAYETEPNTPIVAASLAPPPAPLSDTQVHSGVVGMVQQRNLSGWTVSISTANGTFVKSAQTDDDGYFKVDLTPGAYVLQPLYVPHPAPGQPLPNYILEGVPRQVRVNRNHFSFVVLNTSPGKIPRLPKN